MKNISILYLTHYSELYGANKSLLNLLSGLSSNISPIVIIPFEGPLSKELTLLKIKYFRVRFYPIIKSINNSYINNIIIFLFKLIINFFSRLIIDIIIHKYEINIIHSNSSIVEIGYKCSKDTRRKHFVHIREFQKIDCTIELRTTLEQQIQRFLAADCVIAISNSISKYFNLENKAFVIYNGVVPSNQIRYNLKKEDYILFCGTLHQNKGIEEALRAFSHIVKFHPNIIFKIAGSTSKEYLTRLIMLCDKLKIGDKVIFLGYQSNVLELMYSATCLLMCSKNEAMGRVTVEAMSQGCPVIGYNHAGTSEIIIHDYNGQLYKTINELYLGVIKYIENNEYRNIIIMNAISEVRNKYIQEIYCSEIENHYRRSLNVM